MNVYGCWYKGNLGYCCRQHNMAWMFVPELGQTDNNIHKNIAFDDLIFKNTFARKYEEDNQSRLGQSGTISLLHKFLGKPYKPQTIGGMLFCTMNF